MFSARGHPIDVVEERAPSITETLRVRPCVTQPSLGFSDGDDRAMAVGGVCVPHSTLAMALRSPRHTDPLFHQPEPPAVLLCVELPPNRRAATTCSDARKPASNPQPLTALAQIALASPPRCAKPRTT